MPDFDPDDLEVPIPSLDPDRLDDIRVIMDLERLGELIASVAHAFSLIRGIEPPDFQGEEMRQLCVAGFQQVCRMYDRAEFAASVLGDLENLEKPEVPE